MNPALYQILESHYRKQRLALLIAISVCAVIMLVVIGWGVAGFVDSPPRCGAPRSRFYASCADRYYTGVATRTIVISAILGVIAVICGVVVFPLRDLSQAPLIRLFTSRKDDVAWLYPKRTSVRRYGVEVSQIHEVVVGTIDGRRTQITMTEDEVKACLRLMAVDAPRAAVGYADELDTKFRTSPQSVMKSAAALSTMVSARANEPSARLVIAPECPFAKLDQGIRYLGFTAEAAPQAVMVMPGEPTQALWSGKGMRLAYSFDPMVYLRVVEVFGGDPRQLAGELSSVVSVPVLGPHQITGMLAAADPRTLMLGLRAAEASGTAADRGAYEGIVQRLQGHPDPTIAQAAQRVYGGWA